MLNHKFKVRIVGMVVCFFKPFLIMWLHEWSKQSVGFNPDLAGE